MCGSLAFESGSDSGYWQPLDLPEGVGHLDVGRDQRTHAGACLSYPKPEGPCVEFNIFLATRDAMHFTNFMECSQGRVGHDESL